MLIEFKVTNYLSIREQQTLSMVAANADKSLPSNVIEPALPGISKLKFLKGAAIYGANASGKSNVIRAIEYLANFVKTSATEIKPGEGTGAVPFKLDAESRSKPSEFEITFVAEGVRYQYGLSVTPKRVTEEYLIAYPKGPAQRWFHRTYDKDTDSYSWAKPAEAFKGGKELQGMTRPNSLFLSVGPQFNHPQLTLVLDWFEDNLHFISLSGGNNIDPASTTRLLLGDLQKGRILALLKNADIGIEDAEFNPLDPPDFSQQDYSIPPLRLLLKEPNKNDDPNKPRPIQFGEIVLTHMSDRKNSVRLDYNSEESEGTRRLFALIGPWLKIVDNGYTVFVDEIETSLHPILVKELLNLLFNDETNKKGAQVIFTTHSPTLLDNDLVRRDQIWFTEKSRAGTTHLYPLTDYKPRKDEALAKGYLAGRYGAIPYLPNGLQP